MQRRRKPARAVRAVRLSPREFATIRAVAAAWGVAPSTALRELAMDAARRELAREAELEPVEAGR